jgi:Uma2 family endonuclease
MRHPFSRRPSGGALESVVSSNTISEDDMVTVAAASITTDEYAQMTDLVGPTELVRGHIQELEYATPRHGKTCAQVAGIISAHVDSHDLGHVVVNSGLITERHPDTVRGADVWFIPYSKFPQGPLPDEYLDIPPDIVIEVLSTSDRWPRVLQKVAEYLNVGVPVVCVLDPRNRTARLYFPETPEIVLSAKDDLTFPNQLPGFSVRVGELFE